MEYKLFYIAIRRYAKKRIDRKEFCMNWEHAQKMQGFKTLKPVQTSLRGRP